MANFYRDRGELDRASATGRRMCEAGERAGDDVVGDVQQVAIRQEVDVGNLCGTTARSSGTDEILGGARAAGVRRALRKKPAGVQTRAGFDVRFKRLDQRAPGGSPPRMASCHTRRRLGHVQERVALREVVMRSL